MLWRGRKWWTASRPPALDAAASAKKNIAVVGAGAVGLILRTPASRDVSSYSDAKRGASGY